MRAVRSTEHGIKVVEVPEPEPGPERVRVRVAASAICTSDIHVAETFGALPVTLGHEFAGLLDDGTPVAVRPHVPCGTCDLCAEGHGQLCRTGGARIHGISVDGGMADVVLAHPGAVFPLPGGVPVGDGGLVEPLSVALHGTHRAGVAPGHRVLVVGGGPIGLCAVVAARAAGADVALAPCRPVRAAAGEALGARVGTGGEYDIVLDAAGTQASFDLAVERLRPRGTLGVLGTYWQPVAMSYVMQSKEITVVPAYMYGHHQGSEEFADAVGLLAATPGLADVLITHRFPLADAPAAFALLSGGDRTAIKVVLEP